MKKRIIMKRVVSAAAVLCLGATMLAGCGRAGAKIGAKAPYEASVNKVFISGSRDGDLLVVNVDLKNNSDDYVNASTVAYDLTAKLDGTTLELGYISDKSPEYINNDEKIAAGEEGTAQAVFKLGDAAKAETSDDEAEEEDTDDKETSLKGEVELLGVTYAKGSTKQVEYLKETIDLAEVERVESKSEFELTIDNVVKTDDGEGNDIVIVDMTFTNNSEEAQSFGSAIEMEVFQNSVALKNGYLPYNHPSSDDELESNTYLDIQKGASLKVREVYNLNDAGAPIEVKATDNWSYDNAVILEKEIKLQ